MGEYAEDDYYDDDAMDECPLCHGEGSIITCIDDLCHGAGHCMHGDGEEFCPKCGGEGFI